MTKICWDSPLDCTIVPQESLAGSDSSISSSTTNRTSPAPSESGSGYGPSNLNQSCFVTGSYSLCPYVPGFTMTAMRHEPPEPFGADYTTQIPSQPLDMTNVVHREFLFSASLLPGRTISDQTKTLTITSVVRTGARCGPQLVVVNHNLVAKIYDPLCYDPDEYPKVGRCADRAYSREAAAYSHLEKFPQISDVIPAFHGTWTIELQHPTNEDGLITFRSRAVRLILIEHLQGRCMASLDPHSLSERVRSVILKQCIDAEIRILHTGLDHRDFVPRNIVIMGSDYETPHLQVKVIDFNFCELFVHPRYTDQDHKHSMMRFHRKWAPKLINPIKRYFGSLDDFADNGWCPNDWCEVNKWLWENFGNDSRYIPTRWNPDEPRVLPRYVDEDGVTDDSDCESG